MHQQMLVVQSARYDAMRWKCGPDPGRGAPSFVGFTAGGEIDSSLEGGRVPQTLMELGIMPGAYHSCFFDPYKCSER